MTEKQRILLTELHDNGCSDSEFERFCKKHKINLGEANRYISEIDAPAVCHGCRNVVYFPWMSPCVGCSRPMKDRYEPYEGGKK